MLGKIALRVCAAPSSSSSLSSSLSPPIFVFFDMYPTAHFEEHIAPYRKNISLHSLIQLILNVVSEKTFYIEKIQNIFQDPCFHKQISFTRVAWGPTFFSFFIFRKHLGLPLCFQLVADGRETHFLQALRPIFACHCDDDYRSSSGESDSGSSSDSSVRIQSLKEKSDINNQTKVTKEENNSVCLTCHIPNTITRFDQEQGWLTCVYPTESYELSDVPTYIDYLKDSLLGDCLLNSLFQLECLAILSNHASLVDIALATMHIQTILGPNASARIVLKQHLFARCAKHFDQVCKKAKNLPKEQLQFGVLYQNWLLKKMQKAEEAKIKSEKQLQEAMVRVEQTKTRLLQAQQKRLKVIRQANEMRCAQIILEQKRQSIQQRIDELTNKIKIAEAVAEAENESLSVVEDIERIEKKMRTEQP